ncbi:cell wall biosynthesis protein [Methanobrevibacter sp. TMH8]|uniref:cell wall biosynthesis protein n=1 Tax=Methanobrevibacter sp. TMH8 TaxID=2848611 RepID=UPI001CCE1035|nr:cell wall biosynthesis protein [Methanobrevibacter sp. TMH8]MBZ9570749.1 cell wall biosynthesis protein [Methanobrevibacter sp. TMH8]
MNYQYILIPFIASLVLTFVLTIVFRFLGEKGFLGNLYTNVRGGTPRALGIVPFILLSLFFPTGFNNLILIIGMFALFDDLVGRRKIRNLSIEWGQLSRGIGMIMVMIIGFPLVGYSSILIALFVQPINISDMQPGSTSMVVIIMSTFTILAMILLNVGSIVSIPGYYAIYAPLLLLLVCIGYSPLDFSGKIMLGEVGNHSFAVALGLCFYMLGGFLATLILFIATTVLIALIRKNNLKLFFSRKLNLKNPTFGDYFMDILTGGGLGDAFRRVILKKKQYTVTNSFLIALGFRRLLYNPFAHRTQFTHNKYQVESELVRK